MTERRRGPDRLVIDEIRQSPGGSRHIRTFLRRGAVLAVGMVLLYTVQQQLVEIASTADRLREITVGWFGVMILFELLSFACMWALIKLMLPKLSWFVAATGQLVSNSVSRVVPGGAAVGGATLYRMLSVSGVQPPQAASAMAATGVLSNALLFAIPAVAAILAVLGAPVPERLVPAAMAGAAFFAMLMALGVIAIRYTRPLLRVGFIVRRLTELLGRLFKQQWTFAPERLTEERSRLIEVLGPRWPRAMAAAAGNWAFDYLALIAALYAVGAEPRLSLVLLAYAAAAVLGMVPFTPGGVGFVEVGLYSTLIISGIGASEAGLATIAYRMVSLWLPVLFGPAAWVAFRHRFPSTVQRNQPRPDVAGADGR